MRINSIKIKNLIVGGCSFTAGCGFSDKEDWQKPEKSFHFAHEGLKKHFTEPFTNGNIRKQIEQLAYPTLLGKKLNIKNVKNLAVGGMGYPIHTRRIFSYLLNNQDKINFKETLVILQLTSLQRPELPHPSPKQDGTINYCFINKEFDSEDYRATSYINEHYDSHYLQLKGLNEISFFNGWCKSMGIKVIFLDFHNWVKTIKLDEERKNLITPISTINQHQYTLFHDSIEYPNIDTILKQMDIVSVDSKRCGFADFGYHDDAHWPPEGHEIVAENIYNILTKKSNEK
jgi:hypothetical protein